MNFAETAITSVMKYSFVPFIGSLVGGDFAIFTIYLVLLLFFIKKLIKVTFFIRFVVCPLYKGPVVLIAFFHLRFISGRLDILLLTVPQSVVRSL